MLDDESNRGLGRIIFTLPNPALLQNGSLEVFVVHSLQNKRLLVLVDVA